MKRKGKVKESQGVPREERKEKKERGETMVLKPSGKGSKMEWGGGGEKRKRNEKENRETNRKERRETGRTRSRPLAQLM